MTELENPLKGGGVLMAALEGKRGQIIEAAVVEFQERGFYGASMDRVAARANVSKRTVYNHFESKEALFRAILDIMAAEARAAFDVVYDPARPLEEQLRDLGWAEGRLLTSPDFMKLARIVMSETIRDQELAGEMSCKMEKFVIFQDFMEAAMAHGSLAAGDGKQAADQFVGLIKSQAFWPMIFTGEAVSQDEMARIVDSTVEMFLRQYAPQ